jgi:hypothetical protein
MHSKTISGTVTTAITLGAGAYGDKLTIESTGVVAPADHRATAITVPASLASAQLVNEGEVLGAGDAQSMSVSCIRRV